MAPRRTKQAPPLVVAPPDPFENHTFIVVSAMDDKELTAATATYRRLSIYMNPSPSVEYWVVEIIAIQDQFAEMVARVITEDFDVRVASFKDRNDAIRAAQDACLFNITEPDSTGK